MRLCDFRFLGRELNVVVFEHADQRIVVGLRTNCVIRKRRTTAETNTLIFEFDALHASGSDLGLKNSE